MLLQDLVFQGWAKKSMVFLHFCEIIDRFHALRLEHDQII